MSQAADNSKLLLIVHDDQLVLDILSSYFRNICSVAFCQSSDDAAVLIRQGFRPHVILAAHRYFDLKGDNFIVEAERLLPGVVVVYTVTAQQMGALGMRMTLSGQGYMLLNLDWQPPEIIQAVRLAFQHYRLKTETMQLRDKKSRESTVLTKVREENRISQQRMATETSDLARSHFQLIAVLGELLGALDPVHLTNHAVHTAYVAKEIAKAMNLPHKEQMMIVVGALFHDVGKSVPPIAGPIPQAVLWGDPAGLPPTERALYEKHVPDGLAVLAKTGLPEAIVNLVAAHHEHLDGSGFPHHLSGEAIPVAARVIGAADAFHNAVYRKELGGTIAQRVEAALGSIRARESQFGEAVVTALFSVADHLDEAASVAFERELLEWNWAELFPEMAELHARYSAAAAAEEAA